MGVVREADRRYPDESAVWSRIGVPARGEPLFVAVTQGFDYEIFRKLADLSGLSTEEFMRALRLARATVRRRAQAGRFTCEESDRLYRFAQVFAVAEALFEGDADAARHWLNHAVRGLGGRRPIDMLGTSAETQAVLDLIGRLEHGVFA